MPTMCWSTVWQEMCAMSTNCSTTWLLLTNLQPKRKSRLLRKWRRNLRARISNWNSGTSVSTLISCSLRNTISMLRCCGLISNCRKWLRVSSDWLIVSMASPLRRIRTSLSIIQMLKPMKCSMRMVHISLFSMPIFILAKASKAGPGWRSIRASGWNVLIRRNPSDLIIVRMCAPMWVWWWISRNRQQKSPPCWRLVR